MEGSLGQLGQIRRHAAVAEVEIVGRSAKVPALALMAALAEVQAPCRPSGKSVRSTTGLAGCWLDTMFERAVRRRLPSSRRGAGGKPTGQGSPRPHESGTKRRNLTPMVIASRLSSIRTHPRMQIAFTVCKPLTGSADSKETSGLQRVCKWHSLAPQPLGPSRGLKCLSGHAKARKRAPAGTCVRCDKAPALRAVGQSKHCRIRDLALTLQRQGAQAIAALEHPCLASSDGSLARWCCRCFFTEVPQVVHRTSAVMRGPPARFQPRAGHRARGRWRGRSACA